MNIQTKHVRANFVPSGPVSYNQLIAKKYFKSQNNLKQLKKNQFLNTVEHKSIEHEVVSTSLDKIYKRVEIENWLKSLDLESKIKIFSIQNKWLSQMIQQMFYYYRINPNNKFLLKPDDISNEEYYLQYYYNENQQNYINFINDSNYPLDIFFKYFIIKETIFKT